MSTHIKNCLNFGIAQKGGGGGSGLAQIVLSTFLLRGELFGFYPRPLWSVGLQMDIFSSSFFTPPTFCSYPAKKSSSFVPIRPRKAQVFVSLRYRKRRGRVWVFGCVCHRVFLLQVYYRSIVCDFPAVHLFFIEQTWY